MKPGRDKNDHFYDVEHKFVLFLHQTYLLLTRKIHTFNWNSRIRWSLQEVATTTSLQEDNVHYIKNDLMLHDSRSERHWKDIRSFELAGFNIRICG